MYWLLYPSLISFPSSSSCSSPSEQNNILSEKENYISFWYVVWFRFCFVLLDYKNMKPLCPWAAFDKDRGTNAGRATSQRQMPRGIDWRSFSWQFGSCLLNQGWATFPKRLRGGEAWGRPFRLPSFRSPLPVKHSLKLERGPKPDWKHGCHSGWKSGRSLELITRAFTLASRVDVFLAHHVLFFLKKDLS